MTINSAIRADVRIVKVKGVRLELANCRSEGIRIVFVNLSRVSGWNSDLLRPRKRAKGRVSNNCYRPSVCSVLRDVAAELAIVVAFQSSGLSKRGRSMHGRHYAGALRVEIMNE